ncbi:serine/threonine-protein phosphatase 4 regulatory subunit 2-A [Paramormyrops kingsleyae]|uniref:serine/threonine-protein phosphatase 4 regulatory subunit 2-A n=1 Tax=Paramormyrops kingsleyae TaxID=1676925 RepID=UPI003B96CA3C
MEIDTLLEAFKDFERKGKKEACPVLDQFLCHVAKTGETVLQWSQFKSYFLFKLEKVMDDFRASSPEQRGPANPNVEYIPFEEMKERILKIVDGYNGIPFTIQRLCELLTEPKRNYTGTDKFLRGVEKNVMVVSCVYPTTEKNGSSSVSRMNGVMFPGNASSYTDRNINGPGTPRPLARPKLSLCSSPATNGLPDSTESKEPPAVQGEKAISASSVSEAEGSLGSPVKNKHIEDDCSVEAEQHEVKRLKFDKDEAEQNENEDDVNEEPVARESASPPVAESSCERPESSSDVCSEDVDSRAADMLVSEDQEPSSTQTEPLSGDTGEDKAESEALPGSTHTSEDGSEMDQSEQVAQSAKSAVPDVREGGHNSDPVSSSSNEEGQASDEPLSTSPSSTAELPTEGALENSGSWRPKASETVDEPMEQD